MRARSPARTVRDLEAQIQADAMIMESLQGQLTDQASDLDVSYALIDDLKSSLSTYVTLTHIALIVAAITVIGTIMMMRKLTTT